MPSLSVHFRFASLGIYPLDICQAGSFILGTVAPDAFEPENEDSFSQYHFKGDDGRINLQAFLKATNFVYQPSDNFAWSFAYGYFCHLWLDVYFRDHSDRIHFERPTGIQDTELRNLVRKETEILNAPFVLNIGNLSVPHYEKRILPVGLEFVDLERCVYLYHEVVKQSQAWSVHVPEFKSVNPAEYSAFLEEASQLFIDEFQAPA